MANLGGNGGGFGSITGFEHKKVPTGYGAVKAGVVVCGVDVGEMWSEQTTYSLGTEHCEDSIVDMCEDFDGAMKKTICSRSAAAFVQDLPANTPRTLEIYGLTASPCTSENGGGITTCKKGDMHGCTERLIQLKKDGWDISITYHHLYQGGAETVNGARKASENAIGAMRAAGINISLMK